VLEHKNYRELPNVSGCVDMVAADRADACILDRYLYLHLLKKSPLKVSPGEFAWFPMPNSSGNKAGVVFLDKTVSDDFNRIIARMQSNGRLDRFYDQYLVKMAED